MYIQGEFAWQTHRATLDRRLLNRPALPRSFHNLPVSVLAMRARDRGWRVTGTLKIISPRSVLIDCTYYEGSIRILRRENGCLLRGVGIHPSALDYQDRQRRRHETPKSSGGKVSWNGGWQEYQTYFKRIRALGIRRRLLVFVSSIVFIVAHIFVEFRILPMSTHRICIGMTTSIQRRRY